MTSRFGGIFKRLLIFACLPVTVACLSAYAFADITMDRIKALAILETLLADAGLSQGLRFESTFHFPSIAEDGQERVDVTLKHARLGEMRFLMKGPKGFYRATKPTYRTLVVFSGFGSGQDVVEYLEPAPGTVMIGFDYKYSLFELVEDPSLLPEKLADMIRRSPGQMAAVLTYIAGLPWVKRDALATLGISMGGLFQPAALRMAKRLGVEIPNIAFAYTGAHLTPVVERGIPSDVPSILKWQVVHGVMNALTLYEPKSHLPWLKGKFLVVRATEEEVFPPASWEFLERTLPSPSIVLVKGPHIGMRQKRMIRETRDAVMEWWR